MTIIMKSKTTILTLYLLLSLLLSFELIELAITLRQTRTEEQNFLPMVYENQIYQGSVTDGMTIHCVKFLSEIIHRNVSQPVLVFRYSGLSCHSCVQTSIIALHSCPEKFYQSVSCLPYAASGTITGKEG